VFDISVLRRIYGPRKEEATGEWKKLHNEGLKNLYYSSNSNKMIKSRMMRHVGHVACMEDMTILSRKLTTSGILTQMEG
jgi:hypothetical protein